VAFSLSVTGSNKHGFCLTIDSQQPKANSQRLTAIFFVIFLVDIQVGIV
jgi:hypothetical protein